MLVGSIALAWPIVSIVLVWARVVMVVTVVMNVICMVVAMGRVDYVGENSDENFLSFFPFCKTTASTRMASADNMDNISRQTTCSTSADNMFFENIGSRETYC
jgi:hypothetical protein